MSGDVQPRKRKDKKRKKDELGVEEPRGTAAALGEGDVFMHSPNEHGTGGHWCAKIIFFSLLAVLITLIGLIILENRGLTELEANSVESRYSGVLEGWIEDVPDDDHHDEHTLELKHHDDDGDQDKDSPELDHDDEDDEHEIDDHDDEDDEHEIDDQDDEDDEHERDDHDDEDDEDDDGDHEEDDEHDQQYDNSEEQNVEDTDEDDDNEEHGYGKYDESDEDQNYEADNDDNENDDLQRVDVNDSADGDEDDDSNDQEDAENDQSVENYADADDENDVEGDDDDKDEDNSNENEQDDSETRENEDEEEHEEDIVEDSGVEVERLEKEVSDEDALSEELPTAEAEDDDKSEEISSELAPEDIGDADDDVAEDEEFLEADDIEEDLPVVEHIVTPQGKPLVEVEEEASTMKPADTLADEEEYEKQQEELRREQEQASHMWLKLAVGGALLVATHAVVRRAIAPRDDTPASDEHASREESPVIDRRMTLISEERAAAQLLEETVQPVEVKVLEKVSSVNISAPPPKEESEEEEEEEIEDEEIIETKDVTVEEPTKEVSEDKELYSDEEEAEDEEEGEEIVVVIKAKQSAPAPQKAVEPEPVDEDVPDDVEIINDEQLEEELEEEDDEEEEISDVDDAELLTRLEAKYGRLPEPERPGQKHKDGGNSIEDEWPGEPSDEYWRQQLDQAEQELRQGDWSAASERAAAEQLKGSARARWLQARASDALAEARRDNRLLTRAITAYLDVLKMNERLSNARLLEVANRTLDRIRFRGNYLSAEPIYRLLIRRFPDVPDYHNNLTVSFLMANRADLAEQVIKETLQKWPSDRFALAHYGFVLKTIHNRLEEAVEAFQKALEGDVGPATEPRFYYHLGDSLLLLGRFTEAHEVHKRGAALGHFLSPAQRSLYNVDRLKSEPWWNIDQTPYIKLARALEKSWKEILKEGEAAKSLYEKEKEGLKERGEWSQLDLFVRGQEIPNRCNKAPVTCSIVRSEVAAAGCRRGQVKFSAMDAGTHVRPHVGPTNCRLRMHLGLSNTKDTYIRVDKETRQWKVGKTLMFDDSFEHEVWHNGTGTRLVLIVDVWHPSLTAAERRSLPPI